MCDVRLLMTHQVSLKKEKKTLNVLITTKKKKNQLSLSVIYYVEKTNINVCLGFCFFCGGGGGSKV